MIYHQSNVRPNRRKKRRFLALIAFIVVIIILPLSIFAPHLFSPLTQVLARPFAYSRDFFTASTGDFFESLRGNQSLAAENANLKQQLVLMNAAKAERDMYKEEYQQVEGLLGKNPHSEKTVLARVLEEPGFSPYDTAIIDIGSKDGIKTGDVVFADSSTILGYVSSLGSYTSTVTYYSSGDQKINAFIGSSTIESSILGIGGGNYKIKLPRNATVTVGDPVVSAEKPGFLIGTVGSINTTSADSFEDIYITGPVNVQALKYVFVGLTNS